MLENLHIKNVALIENAEISFGKGLNILSGETGAGKSMIIDSINFALGERVGRDIVRRGEDQAEVEAFFSINDAGIKSALREQGIECDDDGSILIRRTITHGGKTINKINGSTVTAGMLKNLSKLLMDVHGQHEHQSLLDPSKHIILLDKFCGSGMDEKKLQLQSGISEYRAIIKKLKALSADPVEREQKIDILSFQIQEIEDAGLKVGEEEILFERRSILSDFEKVQELGQKSLELLCYSDEENVAALDKLSEGVECLRSLKDIDKSVLSIFEACESACLQLEEGTRELKRYMSDLEIDPDEMNIVEERLNLIYSLKKKYGGDESEILRHMDFLQNELDEIIGSEEQIKSLRQQKKEVFHEIAAICKALSVIRHETSDKIEKEIEDQLKDLEMKCAIFKINIEQRDQFSADGWDKVEFLISTNAGGELKPLAKIASGGEMSRVMLALKSVMGKADNIDTFVFDEIDTGVSGRTAQKVAEKMSGVSKEHQILCITHLPQIAAMADEHFLIEKKSEKDKTTTTVSELDRDGTVLEIARLIAGAEMTNTALLAAREMKEQADVLKH